MTEHTHALLTHRDDVVKNVWFQIIICGNLLYNIRELTQQFASLLPSGLSRKIKYILGKYLSKKIFLVVLDCKGLGFKDHHLGEVNALV